MRRVRPPQPCHCPKHNGETIPYYERVRCHRRSLQESRQSRELKLPRIEPPANDETSSDGMIYI
jgi:hypothetical protein